MFGENNYKTLSKRMKNNKIMIWRFLFVMVIISFLCFLMLSITLFIRKYRAFSLPTGMSDITRGYSVRLSFILNVVILLSLSLIIDIMDIALNKF